MTQKRIPEQDAVAKALCSALPQSLCAQQYCQMCGQTNSEPALSPLNNEHNIVQTQAMVPCS